MIFDALESSEVHCQISSITALKSVAGVLADCYRARPASPGTDSSQVKTIIIGAVPDRGGVPEGASLGILHQCGYLHDVLCRLHG